MSFTSHSTANISTNLISATSKICPEFNSVFITSIATTLAQTTTRYGLDYWNNFLTDNTLHQLTQLFSPGSLYNVWETEDLSFT